LSENLERIKGVICEIDVEAEVFSFGSVAEGRHNYSRDIGVLVVTKYC